MAEDDFPTPPFSLIKLITSLIIVLLSLKSNFIIQQNYVLSIQKLYYFMIFMLSFFVNSVQFL